MKVFAFFVFLLVCSGSALHAAIPYEICSTPAQLESQATRVVVLDINSTEIALALGLAPAIVGVAGVESPQLIMDEYQAVAKNLNHISPFYPSLTQLKKVWPDLVIGGWKNGFSRDTPMEPEALLAQGINSYILRETCGHEGKQTSQPSSFAETLFQDLADIGRLTGATQRAETLLQQMKRRLALVQDTVKAYGRHEPVRVFVYDGGLDQALSIGGQALFSEVIRLAGGRNIWEERPGTWQNVDWADVEAADPELIVIVDYGSGDASYKILDLESAAELQHLEAIQKRRYFIVPYAAAITGIRSVGITELLADHLICTFNPLSQGALQCLDVPFAY
jgi:iron complex transport system substrate-binding protein